MAAFSCFPNQIYFYCLLRGEIILWEANPMSGIFQNINPPPPLRPSSVYPPPPPTFTLYIRKYFVVCWVSANFLLLQFDIQRICSRFFFMYKKELKFWKEVTEKASLFALLFILSSSPLNAEACWHRTRRGFQNLSGTNIVVHTSASRLRYLRSTILDMD